MRTGARHVVSVALLVAAVTLATYAGVVRNDFVDYDDNAFLTANAVVRQGLTWEGVVWAFTTTKTSNWHPLTWLSHMLDVQLFGMNPGMHHLASAAYHAVNAAILFLLLRSLTGMLWRSALVAVLFGIHPLHVESVAWASERKDLLASLGFFLAIWSWSRDLRRGRTRCSVATVVLYVLALMAKPTPVTLPFVLLLLDWWPLGRWAPTLGDPRGLCVRVRDIAPPVRLWAEKVPLFAIAAVFSIVTYRVQAVSGSLQDSERLPHLRRVANAFISYFAYLRKTFWPSDLAVFYPFPATHPPAWRWGAALALLIAVSAVLLRASRKQPHRAVGWFWFVGTLVPVIGFVQAGDQALADRYTYIPLIGIFVLVVWAAPPRAGPKAGTFGALPALLVTGLAVLPGITVRQIAVWRNSLSLHTRTIEVSENNWRGYGNLGNVFAEAGALDKARWYYREALRHSGGILTVRNNLAVALFRSGDVETAVEEYREIIRADPGLAAAHYNLGLALASTGRAAEAAVAYQRAIEIDPHYADALNNLGNLLAGQGRRHDAVALLRRAIAANPRHEAALNNLGMILEQLGDVAEASAAYNRALETNPQSSSARQGLNRLLNRLRAGR